MDLTLEEFASDVGADGPVAVEGFGTRGGAAEGVRTVCAPAGIVRVDAAEMVVECGAATPVDEVLAALAEVGQTVSIPRGGTVGGALAVGRSGITRLGHGPMRDVLLRTRYVSAAGKVTTAGGATVKNVSGFDLCRLLVGSRGTLGFLGDVLLRTRPLPPASTWFRSHGDPFALVADLYRPVAVLWDGTTTWVRLDGHPDDIEAAAESHDLIAVDGPPDLPGPYRWSLPPSALPRLEVVADAPFIAEIGVGIVHHTVDQTRPAVAGPVIDLHRRIKEQFDPTGRLNPGVDPVAEP